MVDWGSVPVWVGTVVACISVAIAVATYVRATFDKERDQAARVGAWVVDTAEAWGESPEGSGHYEGWVEVRLFVANRSDAPIYDVAVRWQRPEGAEDHRFDKLSEPEL